jgi:hypothetical protein
MQVLFDNGVPRGVAAVLKEHVVEEAQDRGWDRLTNGDLLRAAERVALANVIIRVIFAIAAARSSSGLSRSA